MLLCYSVSGQDLSIRAHCAWLAHVQLYHVMRCWKSCDVPKYASPGGKHSDPGGRSPGKRKESRETRVSSRSSSVSHDAFLLAVEVAGQGHWFAWIDLRVRLWRAGFDFRGALDTLQKAVYLAVPASSLLTVIPYWNTKIKHCYSHWLTWTPACRHLLHHYYYGRAVRI